MCKSSPLRRVPVKIDGIAGSSAGFLKSYRFWNERLNYVRAVLACDARVCSSRDNNRRRENGSRTGEFSRRIKPPASVSGGTAALFHLSAPP